MHVPPQLRCRQWARRTWNAPGLNKWDDPLYGLQAATLPCFPTHGSRSLSLSLSLPSLPSLSLSLSSLPPLSSWGGTGGEDTANPACLPEATAALPWQAPGSEFSPFSLSPPYTLDPIIVYNCAHIPFTVGSVCVCANVCKYIHIYIYIYYRHIHVFILCP